MNVLFVCTGNTCRSPMAELLFQKLVKDAGLNNVSVKSAGVEPSGFADIPPEAKEALKAAGVENGSHKPQGLTAALVKEADVILGMEEYHRQAVIHKFPAAKDKIFLLKPYAGVKSSYDGIFDPFGQPLPAYLNAMKEISGALEALLKKIQNPKEGVSRVRKD